MEKSGAQELSDWVESTGRKVNWLAAQIPVNRATVSQWLNGKRTPRMVYRIRIAEITGGAVPVERWAE